MWLRVRVCVRRVQVSGKCREKEKEKHSVSEGSSAINRLASKWSLWINTKKLRKWPLSIVWWRWVNRGTEQFLASILKSDNIIYLCPLPTHRSTPSHSQSVTPPTLSNCQSTDRLLLHVFCIGRSITPPPANWLSVCHSIFLIVYGEIVCTAIGNWW